ncbi:competence protein CoiA [Kitasatospora sp. NPDC057904]|uniref:competence protein CoiA n=1 Tax=Kitasatospora sp. NPDC057904 TaxID=3346275 RepID=UPI0036DBBB4C
MPLTALHPSHGTLDATVDDLGAGLHWSTVHRAKPRPDLRCPACAGLVHAKTSHRGLRFFAHDTVQPHCPSTGESLEHHHLKRALAHAARTAGWHAAVEVPGDGWRADVLATAPDGRRLALEAQLSPITTADIEMRTRRYAAAGVDSCWVTTTRAPWLLAVPSLQVRQDEADWVVVDGHRRLAHPPLAGLRAVACEGYHDRDPTSGRGQRWQQEGTDVPLPWETSWSVLQAHAQYNHMEDPSGYGDGTGAIPCAAEFLCGIRWWRPRREPQLAHVLAAVLHGTVVALELAAPYHDTSSSFPDPIVWTITADLGRAATLTALAYGWQLFHRSENQACGCGDSSDSSDSYALTTTFAPVAGFRLCSRCDVDLIALHQVLVPDAHQAPARYGPLLVDTPLANLPPSQRQALNRPTESVRVRQVDPRDIRRIARWFTGLDRS